MEQDNKNVREDGHLQPSDSITAAAGVILRGLKTEKVRA